MCASIVEPTLIMSSHGAVLLVTWLHLLQAKRTNHLFVANIRLIVVVGVISRTVFITVGGTLRLRLGFGLGSRLSACALPTFRARLGGLLIVGLLTGATPFLCRGSDSGAVALAAAHRRASHQSNATKVQEAVQVRAQMAMGWRYSKMKTDDDDDGMAR